MNGKSKQKRGRRTASNDEYKQPAPMGTLTLRTVCPDKVSVPLKYTTAFSFGGSVSVEHLMNLNSCFDPDRTGAGHQPTGFDQWAAFFNRYRVDRADVSMEFVNNSPSSVANCLVVGNNDPAAINTVSLFQAAVESPFSYNKAVATSGGMNVIRMNRSFALNQIAGVTRAKYEADDTYQAVTSASPVETIILHMVTQDFSFTTNVAVLVKVTITYWTTFYDRNQLSIS